MIPIQAFLSPLARTAHPALATAPTVQDDGPSLDPRFKVDRQEKAAS